MYRIINANPHSVGFYVNKDGGARERVVVPAKGSLEVELGERQAHKLARWEGVTLELVAGTSPAPEPANAAPVSQDDSRVIEVRKVAGNKSAVFLNGVQQGEPTSKKEAEEAAAALKAAPVSQEA